MNRALAFSLLFLSALWSLFVCIAPSTLYWRDTGEFLLGAFFLDIAHPAGFPTYALFANLGALIPFGPIAWRVHLFSSISAICVLGLSAWIVFRLFTSFFHCCSQRVLPFLFLPPILLLGSESFLHQSLFAEVYQLNTVFLLVGYALFLEYFIKKDRRYLLFGAFLGGVACGNHVSVVFYLAFSLFVLLLFERKLVRIFPPLIFLLAFGIAVYLYIPIRANSAPPLNTGDPSSVERAMNLMTDKRDRVLRPQVVSEIAGVGSGSLESFFRSTQGDLKQLGNEYHVSISLLGLLGIVLLSIKAPLLGVLLFGLGATNWLFFKGWQPDPWQPLLVSLAIGTTILLFSVMEVCGKQRQVLKHAIAWGVLLIFTGVRGFSLLTQKAQLSEMKTNRLATETVTASLAGLPQGSGVILEQSWFLALYLQAVEGVRPDLTLLYLPQLLYPEFFSKVDLVSRGEKFLSETFRRETQVATANFSALGACVAFFSKSLTTLFVEPVASLNGPLRNVTTLRASSLLEIVGEKHEPPLVDPPYFGALSLGLDAISHPRLKDDAMNFLEARATGVADYLAQTDQFPQAAQVLREVCFSSPEKECSVVTINNLAVYLIRQERYKDAVAMIADFVKERRANPTLLQNLSLAFAHLSPHERELFRDGFSPEIMQGIHRILVRAKQ